MKIFVIGSGLRQICGDQSVLGLSFIRSAITAPQYRLYALDRRFAALVEVSEGGMAIEGEICQLSSDVNQTLLTNEPLGIEQKLVKLADGTLVASAVSTQAALPAGAVDISEFGNFATFIQNGEEKLR